MPGQEFIFKQAKRIYDDCTTSQKDGNPPQDADGIADAYNSLLGKAQDEFSENVVIQSLEEVHPKSTQTLNIGKGKSVQKVKSRVSQLADALNIDLEDLEDSSTRSELRPIKVSVGQTVDQAQQQNQQQAQTQYVDIDTILDDVERQTMPPDEKEELKQIIQEFEDELDGDRDDSKLRQLLTRAEEYSVDVVAKLGILGLQYGVTDIVTG